MNSDNHHHGEQEKHIRARIVGHHRSDKYGYVFDHILKIEQVIGKELTLPHVVHHHDTEQLVVCENQAYHMFLHQRQRALKACGHASWLICVYCHRYDDPINIVNSKTNKKYHINCEREDQRIRYERRKKTHYGINSSLCGILDKLQIRRIRFTINKKEITCKRCLAVIEITEQSVKVDQ